MGKMCKIGKILFATHDHVTDAPECVTFEAIFVKNGRLMGR